MKERNLIEESTYDGILYFGTFLEKLRIRELDTSGQVPIGLAYLKLSEEGAIRCRHDTDKAIQQRGHSLNAHLHAFGTMLSLLDRVASCTWGCSHGDHVLEYITGRVVGYSQSAFILAKAALYDEALLLVRSAAEIANLFTLFSVSPPSFGEWKALPERQRISQFGPGAVRKKLTLIGVPLPCDDNQYAWLCETAAHATPKTRPQVHDAKARPSVGTTFQQGGFDVALREISLAAASLGTAVVKLADIEDERRNELAVAATTLLGFV